MFTAMARNDAGLRWTAVTIDDGNECQERARPHHHPAGCVNRIAPTALPRSSIIISDEPLSAETNYRTEFVAVLNNHPQGGFITREPSTMQSLRATTASFFPGAIGTIRLGAATISGTITIGGRCRIRFSCLVAKVLE